jgi:hypothetical protein
MASFLVLFFPDFIAKTIQIRTIPNTIKWIHYTSLNEPVKSLVELLNNEEILFESKEKIINQVETIIDDIAEINNLQIVNTLLNELKILPLWENIVFIYVQNENQLSVELISFINNLNNAKVLSGDKIEKEIPDKETADKFIVALLLKNNINNESYSTILNSIPYIYKSLDFTGLSHEKTQLLIENRIH